MLHDIHVCHYVRYMILTSATTLDNTQLGNDRPRAVIRMHRSCRSFLAQDLVGKETYQNAGMCIKGATRTFSARAEMVQLFTKQKGIY